MDRIRREGDPEMLDELKFNNAVREVFLNRFVHMFCAYDHFVIQPNCQVFSGDGSGSINSGNDRLWGQNMIFTTQLLTDEG